MNESAARTLVKLLLDRPGQREAKELFMLGDPKRYFVLELREVDADEYCKELEEV